MANNYCQSSSFITIPADKLDEAKHIITEITTALENSEEYVGFIADIEDGGVWIREEESINPDHVEKLVRTLVDKLDLPGVYVCSWAYTCSKPRIDEFGGGAFAVQKGRETIWINAAAEAERLIALAPVKLDTVPEEKK